MPSATRMGGQKMIEILKQIVMVLYLVFVGLVAVYFSYLIVKDFVRLLIFLGRKLRLPEIGDGLRLFRRQKARTMAATIEREARDGKGIIAEVKAKMGGRHGS